MADAYVYAMPDAFFGEVVAAAVRLNAGNTLTDETCGSEARWLTDELVRWCSDRLARFKVPTYVRFVSEFPMTASGKVQKFKLRQEHQAELQRSHVDDAGAARV